MIYTSEYSSENQVEELQLSLFDSDHYHNVLPNETLGNLQPLRPLQYLGAKGRAIPHIIRQVNQLGVKKSHVLDAFSGSSVVSQALGQSGYNVIANDILGFCAGLAKTFLNINRTSCEESNLNTVLDYIKSYSTSSQWLWNTLIEDEQELLKQGDSIILSTFYEKVPTVWRSRATSNALKQFLQCITPELIASEEGGLVPAYYAGTYFGVKQAVDIDKIRHCLFHMHQQGLITEWQNSVLLTGLISAMSKAVHSAGKHFAQAIKISSSDRAAILHKRLFEDRSIDIWEIFQQNVHNILKASTCKNFSTNQLHYAYNMPIEHLCVESMPAVGLVYADPPYTAQQYSRFYHVPEVIFHYKYPLLQEVNGQVTTGLYPNDKIKSPFCAKSTAPDSFKKLFQLSRDLSAHLLISYSFSLSGSTGNSRMISLEQLLNLGQYYFGSNSVTVSQLKFAYRQLNTRGSAIVNRQDKEFLLLFRNSRD